MEFSLILIAYLSLISAIYLIFLIWFLYLSKKIQKGKVKNVLKRRSLDSTMGTNPATDDDQMKEEAVERIETQFTNIRRIIIPLVTLLFLTFTAFPFLNYIPATYVSIFVAGLGVTLGIAAKPYIENIISGLIISYGKSIRTGDTVEIDGQYSTVEDISLTYTVLKVWDSKRYIIPNSVLLQKEILNFSMFDKDIWAYVDFHVSPNSDLELVKRLAIQAVKESNYFQSKEAPEFWVMALKESSIFCWVAGWAKSPPEAWELRSDIRYNLSKSLSENGIATQNLQVNNVKVPG